MLWERFRRALLVPRTCKRSSQLLSAEQVPPGLGGDEPRRGPPLERGPPGRRRRGGRRGRGERPQPTRFGHHERPETESLCAKTDLPAFTIIGHHKPGFNFSLVTPMVSPRDPSLSPGCVGPRRGRGGRRGAPRAAPGRRPAPPRGAALAPRGAARGAPVDTAPTLFGSTFPREPWAGACTWTDATFLHRKVASPPLTDRFGGCTNCCFGCRCELNRRIDRGGQAQSFLPPTVVRAKYSLAGK